MDDVDEPDEREELFYNNVREKIVSTVSIFQFKKKIQNLNKILFYFLISDFSLAICLVASAQLCHY